MKYINTLKEKSGVYIISNDIDHRIYVGSAINFKHRYRTHKSNLLKGEKCNVKLLNFINKYGIEHLTFTATESCSKEYILKLEQEYLDGLQPFNENGFNINKLAESPLGYKHTDAAKTKMKSRAKRIVSQEERELLSEMKKGIPRSEETKLKLKELNSFLMKPILAFDKELNIAHEFECVADCANYFNTTKNAIKFCAQGRTKLCNGFALMYEKDWIDYPAEQIHSYLHKRFINNNLKPIIVLDINTNEKKEYNTITEFSNKLNIPNITAASALYRGSLLAKKYKISYK